MLIIECLFNRANTSDKAISKEDEEAAGYLRQEDNLINDSKKD